jgi:hypothetical protein
MSGLINEGVRRHTPALIICHRTQLCDVVVLVHGDAEISRILCMNDATVLEIALLKFKLVETLLQRGNQLVDFCRVAC